jgi:4-amino-4-deoxy-L-arabinose transferase-like glycosyltransferase
MKKIILIVILILAAFLRFYHLDSYPALNADEAAIGYNAFSLIQTGKDEHGNPWPIHFQSFNDYKPGLYFYLVIPFVKVLGLNEWAVRLPGAILGVATVLIIYLLTKELFSRRQELKINNSQFTIGTIAAFLLAISPWHIHFSRGGWELNTATFFITAGVWLFIKAINNNHKFLYFSLCALNFIFSLYAYHAARVIVPLLGLGLVIYYIKDVKNSFKSLLLIGIVSLLLLVPLFKEIRGTGIFSRAAGVGLLADLGPYNRVNEQRGEHGNFLTLPVKLLHNKFISYSLAFLNNWTKHYNGEFLFLSGDEVQRNRVPETGQLYLFEIVTVFIGLFAIAKKPKNLFLIIWWLLIAPVASALTFQSPSALRSQNMVIPLEIISAFGLFIIIEWLNSFKIKWLKIFGFLIIGVMIIWNFARYEHMYWVHMFREYPFSSQYGVKELVNYLTSQDKWKKFMITDRYDQPYILFLFYLKYPPEVFQKEHTLTPRDQYGFSTVRSFGNYVFTSIVNWDQTREKYRGYLIAGTNEEIPKGGNIIKNIYGPNGYLYFRVVAN